jgi:acid phosphatase (class A)
MLSSKSMIPGLLLLLGALSVAATAGAGDYYLAPSQVDLTRVLPPPPSRGSAADKADLRAVLDAQRERTPAQARSAQTDAHLSIFRFADVVGAGFTPGKLPFTAIFFQRLYLDEGPIQAATKRYFDRPRPFAVDPAVHPIAHEPANASYPSGHALFAYMVGILLADMVPEKAPAIFARAALFAHNRVVAGVHYPTDVEAGEIAGSVIDNVLLTEPDGSPFQRDLARARAEVRHAIGLQ